MRPIALGYLRSDLSGAAQNWDEIRIRSLAKRYGYNLAKTIVFTDRTADPLTTLIAIVRRIGAEAIFVPHRRHLGAELPPVLVGTCDVITVDDESTYARAYLADRSRPVYHSDQEGLIRRSRSERSTTRYVDASAGSARPERPPR
ncbi:hypothetical protein [Nocardia sp. NPDC051833]|uniref:hypothetical protein n=1 Tax=Nocardia sp. NPDC051833 TaxID=3155674 RepID=UPI00343CB4FF